MTLMGRINGADYRVGGVRAVGEEHLRVRCAGGSAGRGERRLDGGRHLHGSPPVHGNALRRDPALRFTGGQLVLDSEMNPSRGPAKQPTLTSQSKTN